MSASRDDVCACLLLLHIPTSWRPRLEKIRFRSLRQTAVHQRPPMGGREEKAKDQKGNERQRNEGEKFFWNASWIHYTSIGLDAFFLWDSLSLSVWLSNPLERGETAVVAVPFWHVTARNSSLLFLVLVFQRGKNIHWPPEKKNSLLHFLPLAIESVNSKYSNKEKMYHK